MAKKPRSARDETPQAETYPRREPSGWVIAAGTPFIPNEWWAFFSRDPIQAPWDDLLLNARACDCVRFVSESLADAWATPRTRERTEFYGKVAYALGVAMSWVTVAADLRLTQEECDAIEDGFAEVVAGLDAYRKTSDDIHYAGGNAPPGAPYLIHQLELVRTEGDDPALAKILSDVIAHNPFRENRAIVQMQRVLRRLEANLWAEYKAQRRKRVPRRSKGPRNDAKENALLVKAALRAYHRLDTDTPNLEPIDQAKLATTLKMSQPTISRAIRRL